MKKLPLYLCCCILHQANEQKIAGPLPSVETQDLIAQSFARIAKTSLSKAAVFVESEEQDLYDESQDIFMEQEQRYLQPEQILTEEAHAKKRRLKRVSY